MIHLIHMRLCAPVFALMVALLAAGAPLAQPVLASDPAPVISGSPSEALARMAELGISTAPGTIPVHFSEGHEARALALAELLTDAMGFYEQELGVTAPVVLAVLDEADWPRVTPVPYGLPHPFMGVPNVVFLGATAEHEAVADLLGRRDDAPLAFAEHLGTTGLTWDGASALLLDLVGLHEIGHVLTRALGIEPHRRWLSEMLASYIGYAFLREHRPDLATVWDGMLDTVARGPAPAHTSLADFERLYVRVGIPNYQWYQAMLHARGREVYEAQGIAFVRRLVTELPVGASGDLATPALLAHLERVVPGFHAWAERLGPLTNE